MTTLGSRYRERKLLDSVPGTNVQKTFTNSIPHPLGTYRKYVDNALVLTQDQPPTGPHSWNRAYQRTWDQTHPGPPYRTGGPFHSVKVYCPDFPEPQARGLYTKTISNTRHEYDGCFALPEYDHDPFNDVITNIGWGSGQNSTMLANGESFGPQAYARLRPQIERVGGAVAIAELRDLPGMLKTSAKGFHEIWKSLGGHPTNPLMSPKKVADHYLNHQFGWVPFISDINKSIDAYDHGQEYLDQLVKDNNSWVERVRTILKDDGSNDLFYYSSATNGCQPVPSPLNNIGKVFGSTEFRVYQKLVTLVWAAGRFKYYRPEFDRSLQSFDSNYSTIQRYLDLYGVRVNPSVLWKITPWTWLADWFGNMGDLIQRETDTWLDGVVSKYMYVMHHQVRNIYSEHYTFGANKLAYAKWSRLIETKQRIPADTPYGFGLSWGSLSPKQLSILAALGLSRLP